jgi:hypothetical protein
MGHPDLFVERRLRFHSKIYAGRLFQLHEEEHEDCPDSDR